MERCCADQRCPSVGKKVSLPACSKQKGREGCPSFQLQGLLKCCRRDLSEDAQIFSHSICKQHGMSWKVMSVYLGCLLLS